VALLDMLASQKLPSPGVRCLEILLHLLDDLIDVKLAGRWLGG
jgi:hypothetical protein